MNRTTKAVASGLFGAGLAFAALTGPAGAEEVWLNDADECKIFRALSAVVPLWCAQRGDTMVAAEPVMKTRGIYRKGAAPVGATPVAQELVAVQQANPPVRKAINARVQFEFDSFDLTEDARDVLDRLAGVLNDELMRDQVIEIEGHADATGSDLYNLTLSQLRARAVRAYLIQEHRIDGARLPFVGKGESEPYDPADPTAAVNRRVVFANLTG
jgi:outer membrane protein OmpA-like peptidoglycan-associated protein